MNSLKHSQKEGVNGWQTIRIAQIVIEHTNLEDMNSCLEDDIKDLLYRQKKELVKKIKRIKKASEFQDYGWSDLGDDLNEILEELKEEE